MINFENERRKNPGLGKDQICRNIGVKPSSFDEQIQDLNLPHGPYRYDVTAKGKKNSNQQTIILKRIQIIVLSVIKHIKHHHLLRHIILSFIKSKRIKRIKKLL